MIKFRCSSCDTKIGVPLAYSGKRVKCPHCTQVEKVPDLAPGPIPGNSASSRADSSWADPIFSEEEGAEDQRLADADEHLPVESNCPYCGSMVDPNATYCFACRGALKKESVQDESIKPGTADVSGGAGKRLVIAVITGVVAALLGAAVWAGIVCAIDREFAFIAWILGAFIGFVVMIAAGDEGNLAGGLAVLMAILCIVSGKYFIAKWYVLPNLQQFAQSDQVKQAIQEKLDVVGANAPGDPSEAGPLSEEEIQMMIGDSDIVFAAMCRKYCRKDIWASDFTEQLIAFNTHEFDPPDKERMRFENAQKQVHDDLTNAGERELRIMVLYFHAELTGYTKQLYEEMTQIFSDTITKNVSLSAAFKAAFSYYDILWILLAISSAYKIAARE